MSSSAMLTPFDKALYLSVVVCLIISVWLLVFANPDDCRIDAIF